MFCVAKKLIRQSLSTTGNSTRRRTPTPHPFVSLAPCADQAAPGMTRSLRATIGFNLQQLTATQLRKLDAGGTAPSTVSPRLNGMTSFRVLILEPPEAIFDFYGQNGRRTRRALALNAKHAADIATEVVIAERPP